MALQLFSHLCSFFSKVGINIAKGQKIRWFCSIMIIWLGANQYERQYGSQPVYSLAAETTLAERMNASSAKQ